MTGYCINFSDINSVTGALYYTTTIDLGTSKYFVAWAALTWISCLSRFDSDNGIAAEIYMVDFVETRRLYYGAQWGNSNSETNVHPGAYVGTGRYITFQIRKTAWDVDCGGIGVVMV